MNQEKSVFPLCGLALSGFLAAGCIVDVRDGARPRPAVGSLTVEWTVNRRSDPRVCDRYGGRQGADFELIVYRGSREVAREYASCEDFSITVDLPPDEYRAIATLVERGDERPVTTTLPLEDLRIVRGAQLNVDVDFPSTSFL
ncbi:hypothetical protein WME76_37690 [Sorangium sp. So ce119]|uniref:hypothetical protein n=1 Tax=Sorangium sp. So ce119 TaxID=3133279 RepID=UPI003F621DCF